MGKERYPQARELLITADGGGSNGYRTRLWKVELQRLANELQLAIRVCHFPPGTSKWHKIEHRRFSFSSKNWRGRPLDSLATIVNLLAHTTTDTGLYIETSIDETIDKTGIEVSDEEFAALNLTREKFHGEWNYVIKPQNKIVQPFWLRSHELVRSASSRHSPQGFLIKKGLDFQGDRGDIGFFV